MVVGTEAVAEAGVGVLVAVWCATKGSGAGAGACDLPDGIYRSTNVENGLTSAETNTPTTTVMPNTAPMATTQRLVGRIRRLRRAECLRRSDDESTHSPDATFSLAMRYLSCALLLPP